MINNVFNHSSFEPWCIDVTIFIEPKALFHIVGTTMDYEVLKAVHNTSNLSLCVMKETALSAEFVFNNPNSKGTCGCGESFNVQERGGVHVATKHGIHPGGGWKLAKP